jgi:hypothetical protein
VFPYFHILPLQGRGGTYIKCNRLKWHEAGQNNVDQENINYAVIDFAIDDLAIGKGISKC